ncbi:MAG: DUF2752 domain-containing protein [Cyanobacterium sp. T60_A2020_053]|nr:DUF2752 domain-containing protein [Cyanobacterium sp. T60_A2020_053]
MFKITNKKLSPLSIHIRYGVTGAVLSPIIGSFLYGYTNHHSPFKCLILSFTGIPCPSCGLTRSFIALAQGKIILSLQKHLFGLPLFLFFLLTTIHLFLEIISKKKVNSQVYTWLSNKKIQCLILISLVVYYGGKLLILYHDGTLVTDFEMSPLGNLISQK